jgi:hypothetical protein
MKKLFLLLLLPLLFFCSLVQAATRLPPDIVGVWAIDGSEFKDQVLMRGIALYLDSDGTGASVASDSKAAMRIKVVVTAFNPFTNVLQADFIENGKRVAQGKILYFPVEKAIVSGNDQRQRYHRHADRISDEAKRFINADAAQQPSQ